ncbi:hypothetical protein NBRC116493_33630 [Aurantivibrio infirmus]
MGSILEQLSDPKNWMVTVGLVIAGIIVLYIARASAHGVIESFFRLLTSALRLSARSLSLSEVKLKARNREVLIALGMDQAERELNREFFRINKFVERDLGGYPKLQRKIQEQITQINEDYQESGEVPPPSPEWVNAVESVSQLQIKEKNNTLVDKIFQAVEEQQYDVMKTYRQSIAERHSILKKMAPYWRKLSNSTDQVGTHLGELMKRTQNVDQQMEKYEEISSRTDKAERMLKASAITQFSIALIVVCIAMAGAFFNFHLIAFPMSEMVDGSNRIAGFRVSDIAAMVLIFVEITMGIFLLEALHVTRLFPIIGAMEDRMRVRGIWFVGIILLSMACMESGLAFMRDYLAAEQRVIDSSLVDSLNVAEGASWITLLVNMGMGFVLPLALMVVAIPLEYLFNTGRTVVGMILELLLRVLAVTLRILSNICRNAGRLVTHLYDIIIMFPLWIESLIRKPSDDVARPFEVVKSQQENLESEIFSKEAVK